MHEIYPSHSKLINNDRYSLTHRNIYRNFRKSSINSAGSSNHQIVHHPTYAPTQILEKISLLILQSLTQENKFEAILTEIRQALKVDRVTIYRFEADGSGKIAQESVAPNLPQALNHQIDALLPDLHLHPDSRSYAIDNIYEAELSSDRIKTLEQFAIKASLVAPLVGEDRLLGYLMAHQCSKPRQWQPAQIDLFEQIATQIGFAFKHAALLEERQTAIKHARSLMDITQLLRRSLKLEDILDTTVTAVRQALQADRVIFSRFQTDGSGIVVAESLASGCPQALNHQLNDLWLKQRYRHECSADVCGIDNIYIAELTADCMRSLRQFAVKSQLIAPVVKDNRPFGLLIAHQCMSFRNWQQSESDLLAHIATQVGFTLEQAEMQNKLEQIAQLATSASLTPEPLQDRVEQRPNKMQIVNEDNHDAAIMFA